MAKSLKSSIDRAYVKQITYVDNNPVYVYQGEIRATIGAPASSAPANVAICPPESLIKSITCTATNPGAREVTATWDFDGSKHKYIEKFEIKWAYYTPSNGQWPENASTVDGKTRFATFTVPPNSDRAKLYVKPVQKRKNGKTTITGKAKWKATAWAISPYAFIGEQKDVPTVPGNLKVEINGNVLTAQITNYAYEGAVVTFDILQDGTTPFRTRTDTVTYGRARIDETVAEGHKYCVRVMASRDGLNSAYSEYSEDIPTAPSKVNNFTAEAMPFDRTDADGGRYRIKLAWDAALNVSNPTTDKYVVGYSQNPNAFIDSPSEIETWDVPNSNTIPTSTTFLPNDAGTWFICVRGENQTGAGEWSDVQEVSVGQPPEPPTTWSYTTSVKIGDIAKLNWVHNSADNSKQRAFKITITANGETVVDETIETDDKTYSFDTTGLADGTILLWKVATKGAYYEFSEPSVEREIRVFTEPTCSISIMSGNGQTPSESAIAFESYPMHVTINAFPPSQNAISMDFAITAKTTYISSDDMGRLSLVSSDVPAYTRRIDNPDGNTVEFELGPGDLNLAAGTTYTASVIVYMSSGLQATSDLDFYTAFTNDFYEPMGSVTIDFNTLTAVIYPFCLDQFGGVITGDATFSVYRLNYDGTFTEIQTGLPMEPGVSAYDPHPTLDFANYRVVVKSNTTGQISYVDLAPEPVGATCIVLQWDNEWIYVDENGDQVKINTIMLPYDVDVSDGNTQDVELIEYIGREHPVSYYGTQKGYSSQWKCNIPKDDAVTLYNLRRLARYAGDVYVREPNGSGYWAQVKVQYNIDHNSVMIPVSLDVTRVEGGK